MKPYAPGVLLPDQAIVGLRRGRGDVVSQTNQATGTSCGDGCDEDKFWQRE